MGISFGFNSFSGGSDNSNGGSSSGVSALGTFFDTTTQFASFANNPYEIKFNTTDISEFVQIANDPNNPDVSTSNFQTKHRIIGSLDYKFSYGDQKQSSTSFSLFYTGRSGQTFTYLYNGDLNGDGAFSNDLMYIPRFASEIKLAPSSSIPATAANQWYDLDQFIKNDPYLSKHRGEYAKRNGAMTPWENQFDLRITQDFGGIVKGTKNKLQLTFDIYNVGNMINKNWGKSYFVSNQANTLISYSSSSGGSFSFKAPTNGTGYIQSALTWSGQFGVRYLFN